MARMLFAVLAALIALPAFAVEIPVECRVRNHGNYCTWASVETLGRLHGVKPLHGLMRHRRVTRQRQADEMKWESERKKQEFIDDDLGYMPKVYQQLCDLNVKCIVQDDYVYDYQSLAYYARTHGVVVTLMGGNSHSIGCHSVVLTHYDGVWAEFYDSSQPFDECGNPKIWRCGAGWLQRWWSGSAIVILPEEAR